jgi:hypothetical protein
VPPTNDDLIQQRPTAPGRPGSREADRFVVGLILVFEACAAVAVLAMVRPAIRFVLAQDHAVTQISAQAARVLPYWAGLVYVHAIALAWFRRAGSVASGLWGFAGIVYLGCGYVFSLVLASVGQSQSWPEDMKAFCGIAVAPNLTWLASLVGCLLLLRGLSLTVPRNATVGVPCSGITAEDAVCGAPAFRRQGSGSASPLVGRALLSLIGTSLLLVAAFSLVVFWRAGWLVAAWLSKQSAERSLDFLAATCYAGVYLLASLMALTAAVVCGWRARKRDDPELLWQAGILAVAGGWQHAAILGLPALVGGILAIRSANRRVPRPAGTLVGAIRQSWGLPAAAAVFFLLVGLLFGLSLGWSGL